MQANFATAFSLIKQQFLKVVETMDSIKLYGNFSILEFFIALLVLGAILPIVIITVANWSTSNGAVRVASDKYDSYKKSSQQRKNTAEINRIKKGGTPR